MIYEPRFLVGSDDITQWFKVKLDDTTETTVFDRSLTFGKAFSWCVDFKSQGKFSIDRQIFYFNRSDDGIMFSLKWS